MTHTPGPWEWNAYWDDLRNSDGDVVLEGSDNHWISVGEEDGRLIAAAPDLLAACEAARHALVVDGIAVHGAPSSQSIEAAIKLLVVLKDAIAKATEDHPKTTRTNRGVAAQ